MKKLLVVVILAALSAAAFYFHRQHRPGGPQTVQVADWLSPGTWALEEIPDIKRSEQRWPSTALWQILHEPQVHAFLEKPLKMIPAEAQQEKDKRKGQWQKIDPTQAFLAFTDWPGEDAPPKIVLGVAYAGSKEELQSLLGELRQQVRKAFPAGKSDVVKDAAGEEIETFAVNKVTAGLAYRGNWIFLGSDLDTLKATLDAQAGKGTKETLASSDAFKKCLAEMPADPDAVFYMQPKLLAGRLTGIMATLQPAGGNPHAMDSLRLIDAFALGAKMDGLLMREAMFTLTQQKLTSATLANNALKLSTESTLVYADYGLAMTRDAWSAKNEMDVNTLPPPVQAFLKQLQSQGVTMDGFFAAYGPEAAFLFDWPAGSPIPAPLLSLDVQDAAKARPLLDKLLQTLTPMAGLSLTKQEDGGVTYYSMPPTSMGFSPLQATVGISDKFLLVGLTRQAVQDGMKRTGGPGALGGSQTYKDAMALVQTPTAASAYFDDRGLFERIYNLLRGIASMGVIPHSADFVDLNKLPDTDSIGKHLSPIVVSTAVKDGGVLMQSAGPVAAYGGAIFVGMGAGIAAIPYYMMLHGGPPGIGMPGSPSALPSPNPVPPMPAAPIPSSAPDSSPSAAPAASPADAATPSGTAQ